MCGANLIAIAGSRENAFKIMGLVRLLVQMALSAIIRSGTPLELKLLRYRNLQDKVVGLSFDSVHVNNRTRAKENKGDQATVQGEGI